MLLTSPSTVDNSSRPRPFFEELHSFFSNLQFRLKDDTARRLYIYLSGHGISPTGTETFRNAGLVMADSRPPVWQNFPANIWAKAIQSTTLFQEVVLIMDCCRDLKNEAIVIPPNLGLPTVDSTSCHLVEAYAAGWAAKAREAEFGPNKEKHGIFTHSLLEVLRAGRMNGRLLKESVIAHLKAKATEERPYKQPEINTDDALAMLTFNERADPPLTPVIIRNHPDTPPQIEFFPEGTDESSMVNVDNWTFTGTEWRGMLSPTMYELRLPTGRTRRLPVLAGVPVEVSL